MGAEQPISVQSKETNVKLVHNPSALEQLALIKAQHKHLFLLLSHYYYYCYYLNWELFVALQGLHLCVLIFLPTVVINVNL